VAQLVARTAGGREVAGSSPVTPTIVTMKTLKLDHTLATLVREGKKTSTWRLYDDKDLSVNDDVQIIDKVDPKKPATWRAIGIAHINTIVQKRLRDLNENDYEGHERFESDEAMLRALRTYYGDHVDLDTPVKIIRFTFDSNMDESSNSVVEIPSYLKDIKLYSDGGSRGNPGPSAAGFAILDESDHIVVRKGVYLGVTTNNQAEYQALKLGLEEALRMRAQRVEVYMDSLLVINQMLGIFKVKNRDLWPIHAAIKELTQKFKSISFTHVPRQLNKIADAAVNEALDEAAKQALF
jgi:ribonuclease HI